MQFENQSVELNRIYLDNENPRHNPIEDEHQIIAHLVANESIKALAKHIAESAGQTSPLERIAVIAHPKVSGAYIALEGNRRICALKLLSDPEKASTEKDRAYFRTQAKIAEKIPRSIEVVIFKDRNAARPWISIRHEGPQNGVGTREWDSSQKARFNAQGPSANNPNIQSLLLKNYALKQKLLSESDASKISITTLTRYLSNPVFRHMLGLADNKSLNVLVPQGEFNTVIKRFLTDALRENSDVNSRTNVTQRKAYAQKLLNEGVAPVTHAETAIDLSLLAEVENKKPAKNRNNRSPDDRNTVIDPKFSAHIHDKVLKRLYDELRHINAKEFSFAATYLLRAVIEQTATLYLKQHGEPTNDQLHIKLQKLAQLLSDNGMSKHELKFLRTMASKQDSSYSPDTLGHFVHGGAIPTHTEAIKLWDNLEKILGYVFGQLK